MGKKIVIIDDDHVIQESLQELFTDAGYLVFWPPTASAGYELIVREKPDMVRGRYPAAAHAWDRPVRKDQGQR